MVKESNSFPYKQGENDGKFNKEQTETMLRHRTQKEASKQSFRNGERYFFTPTNGLSLSNPNELMDTNQYISTSHEPTIGNN